MEELEQLQNEFKMLQKQKTSFRLSERSVVDIIVKLVEMGKLTVLQTMNGKELVTPDKLDVEILDELVAHRGRINLTELQPLLNIDLAHIEKKVDELVKKDAQYRLVQGELISNFYLNGVVEEINETIQSLGELHMTDLSRRFALSSDFLQDLIGKKLGKQIKARLEGDMIFTEAFIKRQEAQIRGLFSAITQPTFVASVLSQFKLYESLFYSILEDLISSGKLPGSVLGRRERAQYIPNIYNQARQAWIESFFEQNGYIEYNALSKAQISDPVKFLKIQYPKGLALDNYFVADRILLVIDSAVDEAIRGDSWIDVSNVAPSTFSQSDLSALLQACPSLNTAPAKKEKEKDSDSDKIKISCETTILCGIYVVSKGFLERCLRLFEEKLEIDVRENAAAHTNSSVASSEADESEDDAASSGGGRKGRAKGKTKAVVEEEEEDERPTKGKGARRGAKGKKRNETSSASTKKSRNPSDEVDKQKLLKWLKDSFDEECSEEFLEAVVDHLKNYAYEIKQSIAKAIFRDAVTNQRKRHEQFLHDFDARFTDILLFQKSALSFSKDTGEDDDGLLEKHLLRTLCADVVNLIVQNQALHHFIEVESISTTAERSNIVSQLPPKVGKVLDKMAKTLTGKSVEKFVEEVEAAADQLQLQIKKLDKKKERQLIFAHRQAMMEQLRSVNDPPRALHLALLLLYLKTFGVPVHCPGRAASLLLRAISSKLPKETVVQIEEFQSIVVGQLQASAEASGTDAEPDTSVEIDPDVAAKMEAIKAIATAKGSASSSE